MSRSAPGPHGPHGARPVPAATPSLGGREAAAVYDPARLAEVARLGLDDAAPDAVLLAAVREAAERLHLPASLVSVVLDEAQAHVAAHGVDGWIPEAGGLPIEWSFCRFAVADAAPFVVEDATRDPRLDGNPLVALDGVGCYAGAPLVTSRGVAVGSFCVFGPTPRRFAESEIAWLREAADAAMAHLERRADPPR